MRLHVIPSPFYAANGLVLVPSGAGTALVVDPSAGIRPLIRQVLELEGVSVGAVLLTHGHPDHVWDAAEVSTWGADGSTVPCYLPSPDMYRMDDPASFLPMAPPDFVGPWVKPTDLREMPADSVELTPGVWLRMVPAPGHTEGSALFLGHSPLDVRVNNQSFYASEKAVPWALSADVLFKDSVGRTDMPGGDETQMRHSLRTISNALDPSTILIPGHGPATTLADEITSNQYLIRARRIG